MPGLCLVGTQSTSLWPCHASSWAVCSAKEVRVMEESAKEETIGIRNVGEKNGFINDTNSNSSIQLETYGVVRDVGRTRFFVPQCFKSVS